MQIFGYWCAVGVSGKDHSYGLVAFFLVIEPAAPVAFLGPFDSQSVLCSLVYRPLLGQKNLGRVIMTSLLLTAQ